MGTVIWNLNSNTDTCDRDPRNKDGWVSKTLQEIGPGLGYGAVGTVCAVDTNSDSQHPCKGLASIASVLEVGERERQRQS